MTPSPPDKIIMASSQAVRRSKRNIYAIAVHGAKKAISEKELVFGKTMWKRFAIDQINSSHGKRRKEDLYWNQKVDN